MAGTGTRKMGNAKAPRAVRGQTSTNKRVAVGSKNTTSARTVKATVTPGMKKRADTIDRARKNGELRDKAKGYVQKKTSKGVMPAELGPLMRDIRGFKKGGMV